MAPVGPRARRGSVLGSLSSISLQSTSSAQKRTFFTHLIRPRTKRSVYVLFTKQKRLYLYPDELLSMPFRKYGAVAVWVGLVSTSCGPSPSAGEVLGWPRILRFSVSINQENPETEGERLQPIRRYLEQRMQMPVEVTGTSGYGVVIEAFRAKKIEASSLGPFSYVIGSERAGIEAIATRGTPAGEPLTYAGTLDVKA